MTDWTNSDGLRVKMGRSEGIVGTALGWASELSVMADGEHLVKITLKDMTALGTAFALVSDTVTIPNGAFITRVVVINETIATGTNAVLNVGLYDQDRTTVYDADGLVAALPMASADALGETVTLVVGSTYAGSAIGTVLTNTSLISADYDTAAYTAGKLEIRVYYLIPSPTPST